MSRGLNVRVYAQILLAVMTVGCMQRLVRKLAPPEEAGSLDRRSPYLKAHMRDGSLYVLSQWVAEDASRSVSGQGELFDPARKSLARGPLTVAVDSVALFETNVVQRSPTIAHLAVVTGVSAAATAACLVNPKACFGSCPTFYVSDGEQPLLQAEGFSDSVAPSLEARDVDALFRARPTGGQLVVRMTNEALETHVVRHVALLAALRPPGGRVLATAAGEMLQASRMWAPSACQAAEGDCLDTVRALDGRERTSETDPGDLATRELVELAFPDAGGDRVGVVIGSRQTLLNTFLLYQTLAYMGRSSSAWLATLEGGGRPFVGRARGIREALGGIEVFVPAAGDGWVRAGEVDETGPLAADVKVVPLPPQAGPPRVRLRLTRGHWRLDFVALARLGAPVEPKRLEPRARHCEGGPYARGAGAPSASGVLTTLPGDACTFAFSLPEPPAAQELFLESRGYYLEWIRDEWLKDESSARVVRLLHDPRQSLRDLAPVFKRQEREMEDLFWGSRYAQR
jgi:hypothetical protein